MLNPDNTKLRDIELLKNKLYQKYHYLVPYKIKDTKSYQAPLGKKFNVGLVDNNPTTATLFNRIALMPCIETNLAPLLELTNFPDYYIGLKGECFFLYIKINDKYVEVPAQKESIACWQEYAHPHISYHGERNPDCYKDIDWNKVVDDLRASQSEYVREFYDI